ncbi:hypothetical protein [Kingella oralis]|uniref:hypothetical protein n=1 Tax=Kingella oralis TaxID=505 RepID=UPI002D802BA4|nr:hypothetical protein [Kingella oralis]
MVSGASEVGSLKTVIPIWKGETAFWDGDDFYWDGFQVAFSLHKGSLKTNPPL